MEYGKKIYGQTELELIEEENSLTFNTFDYKKAEELFMYIKTEMDKPKGGFKPMGVEIILNNITVYSYYQYGATKRTISWIKGKRKTVEYFGLSSACIDVQANELGVDVFCNKFGIDPSVIKLCGGAMPIIVKGLGMVGIVSISGLSRREDHDLCVHALRYISIY